MNLTKPVDEAYKSFNDSAAAFLENNAGLDSSGPASKVTKGIYLFLMKYMY